MHPEGGTLAYLIRFHGHKILAFGGMNCIEREIGDWNRTLFEASQQASIDALQSFIEEIKAASPKTKVITPKHFEPIPLGAAVD